MGVYEKYNKWPEWLRWILFLPLSLIGSTALAWIMRITLSQDALKIVVDLGFPLLWQALFLGFIFFTVPRCKMGWTITFFSLRVIEAIIYIGVGIWVMCVVPEDPPTWADYWKQGVAEVIAVLGSIGVLTSLKETLPSLQREIADEIDEY